jgi:hypothetical protein
MNRTQKIIVLAAAVFIIAAILFPPYFRVAGASNQNVPVASGWTLITGIAKVDTYSHYYTNIRLDLLVF